MYTLFPLAQAQVPLGPTSGPAAAPEVAAPAASAPATTLPGTAVATRPGAAPSLFDNIFGMLPFILLIVAVYFFLMRGQRKEEKNRKAMIAEMKKGDEVILISGKFGKVMDIRDDRVIIKVDEANNVKETYLKSAVQRVVSDDDEKK